MDIKASNFSESLSQDEKENTFLSKREIMERLNLKPYIQTSFQIRREALMKAGMFREGKRYLMSIADFERYVASCKYKQATSRIKKSA